MRTLFTPVCVRTYLTQVYHNPRAVRCGDFVHSRKRTASVNKETICERNERERGAQPSKAKPCARHEPTASIPDECTIKTQAEPTRFSLRFLFKIEQ